MMGSVDMDAARANEASVLVNIADEVDEDEIDADEVEEDEVEEDEVDADEVDRDTARIAFIFDVRKDNKCFLVRGGFVTGSLVSTGSGTGAMPPASSSMFTGAEAQRR